MESKKRNSLKPTNHPTSLHPSLKASEDTVKLRRTSSKKIIILAFLLSLLFHVGSLVYVTLQKPQQSPALPLSNPDEILQQKNKQQNNEWVEAKARAGNFGTPVFFQDEFEPAAAEAMADRPSFDEASEDRPELIEDTTKEKEQLPKKEKITESIIPEEKKEITKDKPTATIQDTEIKPAPSKKIIQQKTTPPKPHAQNPKQLAAPVRRSLGEGGPKPPLTLAQLSQGFLNHVKDEGKHAIHMLGKKGGTPSDEQIKYERYLQKLSWCLQNSFNINNDRFPRSASGDDSLQVLLALNKDGSLKDCRISKTSGNRDLDFFTLFIFKDASTSFPPVPQYLPHDPFAINYIIMVGASEEGRLKLYRQ
jgi:outer membrane biosynthesis protein TonB